MNAPSQLTTARLWLRKPAAADVPFLVRYASHRSVSDNLLNVPHPYAEEDAVFWLNFVLQGWKTEERFVFAVAEKESGEFMGAIGLHPAAKHNAAEMGYWLGEPFWGAGFMTEAAAAVLRFGFEERNLHKIYATHFTDNPASGKVMVNNGMIREGEWKNHYKVGNVYKSVIQYRLLKDEWEALQAAKPS